MDRPLALVVERDPNVRALIAGVLNRHEFVARDVSGDADVMEALRAGLVGFVIADADAPGLDVEQLLARAGRMRPVPVVIAITEAGDPARAEALIERGAFEALARPVEPGALDMALRKARRQRDLLDDARRLRAELQRRDGYHGIVGRSPAIDRLREEVERLASSDAPVWFWGEHGTGKELAARTLHRLSERSEGSFVTISCRRIEPGNWTRRLGVDGNGDPLTEGPLKLAEGGVVLLHEPDALSPELQTRLLAMLDAPATRAIDLRWVVASSSEPTSLAEQGRLSEELRARLSGETVAVPALRARKDDIPLLAAHFITSIRAINRLPPIQLAPEALEALVGHGWPDNVQGLRDAMEQAVIVSLDDQIRSRDLPEPLRNAPPEAASGHPRSASSTRAFREAKREVVEAFERTYLTALMDRHGGNVTAAAQKAGMLRSALQRLLRKYGLKSASFRRPRRTLAVEETTRPAR